MILESTAPVALHLAGSGLDIYPIPIFEEGCITLSMAISPRSNVRLRFSGEGRRLRIYSEDLREKCIAGSLDDDLPLDGPFGMILRAVKFYAYPYGLDVIVRAGAGEGTGLSVGPSVLIALSSALNYLTGSRYTQSDMIQIGAHLESQTHEQWIVRSPYYPSAYGGLQCLWHGMESNRVENMELDPLFLKSFQEFLTLALAEPSLPASHQSWGILKRYMDRSGSTRQWIRESISLTHAMRQAFVDQDCHTIAGLLSESNRLHQSLLNGSAPNQGDPFARDLHAAGAFSWKSFGPDGKGCLLIMHPPEKKPAIHSWLASRQLKVLPFSFDADGVRIRSSR